MTMTAALLLLAACGGKSSSDEPDDQTLYLTDEHLIGYEYTEPLPAAVFGVEPGADLCFDWSGLTRDLTGEALAEGDLQALYLVEYSRPAQDVAWMLTAGALAQSCVQSYAALDIDAEQRICLSGMDTTYLEGAGLSCDPERSWLLALSGGDLGGETLSYAFLDPCEGGAVEVAIDDSTASDEAFPASPLPAASLEAAAGSTPRLDWSALTTTPAGDPLDVDDLLRVDLAHYESSDLDQLVFNDEPAGYYTAPDLEPTGSNELTELEDSHGASFSGFTTAGTWLVSFPSTDCQPHQLIALIDVK
jgi:hypothetical protein